MSSVLIKLLDKGLIVIIRFACRLIFKMLISLILLVHLLSTHANIYEKLTFLTLWCAYQGAKNVSFSENFAYVLNRWSSLENLQNNCYCFDQLAELLIFRTALLVEFPGNMRRQYDIDTTFMQCHDIVSTSYRRQVFTAITVLLLAQLQYL